ncbi:MAG: hypothetical protein OXF62_14350 [Caldilineaceae bacterium]|nr:hypothetical protein [Caldilineaceae bacterium]
MTSSKDRKAWEQRPNEPNPAYVAFVLFASLGPDRESIVKSGTGKSLWEMLMAGLERMDDTAPLPAVCEVIIHTLKNMLEKNLLDHLDKDDENYAFVEQFHEGLQKAPVLKDQMNNMISNLEKLKRGEKL